MNEQEYRENLARHDWTYNYSDDYGVWRKGDTMYKLLSATQKRLDPDFAIWNSIAPEDYRIKPK